MQQAVDPCRREVIAQLLKEMVPGYQPGGLENAQT